MKGFVPTPASVVDLLVDKLFSGMPPQQDSRVLDPGCGPGAFIAGILRWCSSRGVSPPHIVGVEADSAHVASARREFASHPNVEVRHANFLSSSEEQFDYVVGNPPYVSIGGLSEDERHQYRTSYRTATNRFDLYVLFFEQALKQLKQNGRLVFITPEKFLYVESAAALRSMLVQYSVEELHFLPEDTFADLVTYPLVTTVGKRRHDRTAVITRAKTAREAKLPLNGASWIAAVNGAVAQHGATLQDVALRISCGVATGADAAFVFREDGISPELRSFAYPTISGRQLVPNSDPVPSHLMLVPYDRFGTLLPEGSLGSLGKFLSEPHRKERLLARTCVRNKPWYAFHENPPMTDLLRPKILCKDIGNSPFFFPDRKGRIIPRHSVYYVVPRSRGDLQRLTEYLNSATAREWLMQHCQRAAQGFVRLQSHVLKRLPVPASLVEQLPLVGNAAEDVPLSA
jgi:adenine-specific DNA-methyltransferase